MIMKKTQPLYNAFFARSLQYRVIMEAFLILVIQASGRGC